MQYPPNEPRQPGTNGDPAANGTIIPIGRGPTELVVPSAPPGTAPRPPGREHRVIIAAFRRRWFLALSLGLIFGSISAAAAWYLIPAPYTAFAAIRMRVAPPKIMPGRGGNHEDFRTYKETQMRMLRSPFVLTAALRTGDVSKCPTLKDVPYPVEWLEENLEISSPNTEFVHISLSGDHPQDLADIVNAVYNAYLDDVDESSRKAQNERLKELTRVRTDLESRLRTKQNAVRQLTQSLTSSDTQALSIQQQLEAEKLGQIRKLYSEIRFDLMRAQTQLAMRKAVTPDAEKIEIPDARVDLELARIPAIQQLELDVQQKEDLFNRTKAVIASEKSPVFIRAQAELDKVRTKLQLERERLRPMLLDELRKSLVEHTNDSLEQVQSKVEQLTIQEETLRKEIKEQKSVMKQRGTDSYEMSEFQREIEQMTKMVDSFTNEIDRLQIELDAPPRTTGHQPAQVPHQPDMAKKQKLSALAGFGVFGLIVAAITWLEFNARRISSLDEVAEGLSLRILGSLPVMPGWVSKGKKRGKSGRHSVLRSVWTESIDAARTVLLRDARVESMKVVMICSAVGGEGKTTLSCHLATSLARSGRKTLLIDTDMRRSSLHKVFDVEPTPGFCELVRGEVELKDALRTLPTEGLSLLTAGKIDQQTLKQLSGKASEGLFDQIKQEFDFVIVDSAPLLPVTDSLLIAQHVDAALFSIRRDVSRYGKVANACERLAMLGIPMLGAVVTGLDEGSYGYRYPYRYYAYGGYGYNVNVHTDAAS